MDELLVRSIKGQATPAEESAVTAWRRRSPDNEALYQRLVRLLPEAQRREAWLEGRAYFAVAKIEGQPFEVRTRTGTAQVLGTRFDLSVDDNGLRLMVAEGRVALSADGKRVDVKAGEVSQVIAGSSFSVTRVPDVLSLMDWKGSFLAFQSTPLKDVAREIGRQ